MTRFVKILILFYNSFQNKPDSLDWAHVIAVMNEKPSRDANFVYKMIFNNLGVLRAKMTVEDE